MTAPPSPGPHVISCPGTVGPHATAASATAPYATQARAPSTAASRPRSHAPSSAMRYPLLHRHEDAPTSRHSGLHGHPTSHRRHLLHKLPQHLCTAPLPNRPHHQVLRTPWHTQPTNGDQRAPAAQLGLSNVSGLVLRAFQAAPPCSTSHPAAPRNVRTCLVHRQLLQQALQQGQAVPLRYRT